jgi:hypothetical protein
MMNRDEAFDVVRDWAIEYIPLESVIKVATNLLIDFLKDVKLNEDQRNALLYLSKGLEIAVLGEEA